MSTRHFFTLAALIATMCALHAQQIQVKFGSTPLSSGPAVKPGSTEFKPDPKADPDPKSLDVPADVQQKVADLVRKLGSPVYRERVKASRDLVTFGRLALPALAEAAKSSDEPEVVERAESLMPKAQVLDMKARVACFLADADGKYEHTLPGWARFKDTAGNTKASRELFAEALKNKVTHQMLLAAEQNPEDAGTVLSAYLSKIGGYYNRWGGGYEQPATPKTADLAVAMFLEGQYSDRQVVISMPFQWGGQQYMSVANHIGGNSDFSAAQSNRESKYKDPLRKILQKWMDTRETANGCNQAYYFAQQMFGRKPALKYAAKVLAAEGLQNTQYLKTNILQQLGTEGAKEYLPDIVKCFDDSTVYSGQNSSDGQYHEMQLRDYALYVAVQMTDQTPKDYGFTPTATGSGTSKQKLWHQSAFYFKDDRDAAERGPNVRIVRGGRVAQPVEDPKKPEEKKPDDKAKKLSADDKRKAAFKKWTEWEAANMKDGKLIEQPKKADESKKDAPKTGGDAEAAAKDADAKARQLKEEAIKKDAAAKAAAAAAKAAEDAKKKEEKK